MKVFTKMSIISLRSLEINCSSSCRNQLLCCESSLHASNFLNKLANCAALESQKLLSNSF